MVFIGTMCLICKKSFEKLHKHHVSYKHNCLIEVCVRCHKIIHNTSNYSLLKPIDGRKKDLGDYYTCVSCGTVWIDKDFKKPFRPCFCPRCKNENVKWLQDGNINEKTEPIMIENER